MMGRRVWVRLAPIVVLMLVVGACSSGEATPSDGDDTTTSTTAASSGDTVASEDTTTTEAGNEPAATPPDAGSATLTIGDQTWTFDNYYCAFGPEETGNERVSFSSGAFGTAEGVRTQLDASIQDARQTRSV